MNNRIPAEYSATGTLLVSVSTAGGALPVPDALVTVRLNDRDASGVLTVLYTDQSGNTPRITLPAPPAEASESPGNATPYAKYSIEVDKEGFYPRSFNGVPVFANTTSIQPVNLLPIAEYEGKATPPSGMNVTESQNPNL